MFILYNPPYSLGINPDSTFELSYTIQGQPIYSKLYIGTFQTIEAAIDHIKELLKQEGDKYYNWYIFHGFKGSREEFDQFCCFELSDEKIEELCGPSNIKWMTGRNERYQVFRELYKNSKQS